MRDRTVENLLDLFERERTALRRGDVTGAARLGPRKEKLLSQLRVETIEPGALARLRAAADRNAGLLTACRKGIEAARDRVAALRNPAPDRTYSALGVTHDLATTRTTLSRRA